jgi:hypothetical protein
MTIVFVYSEATEVGVLITETFKEQLPGNQN